MTGTLVDIPIAMGSTTATPGYALEHHRDHQNLVIGACASCRAFLKRAILRVHGPVHVQQLALH